MRIQLNALTRITAAVLLTLPLMLTLDWLSATVATGLELILALALGFPGKFLWHRLVPIFLIAPIAACSMLLYGNPRGHTLFHWGLIHVTDSSAQFSIAIFLRIFALAIPAIVLFSQVDATDMADGLIQKGHLPPTFVWGAVAGGRTLTLFRNDWTTMEMARRARGLGDTGRFKRFFTMAFTLLVFALRRGVRMAAAMEARGFGSDIPRTNARLSVTTWVDGMFIAGSMAVIAIALGVALATGTFYPVWS